MKNKIREADVKYRILRTKLVYEINTKQIKNIYIYFIFKQYNFSHCS